jgi:hypothetical protein
MKVNFILTEKFKNKYRFEATNIKNIENDIVFTDSLSLHKSLLEKNKKSCSLVLIIEYEKSLLEIDEETYNKLVCIYIVDRSIKLNKLGIDKNLLDYISIKPKYKLQKVRNNTDYLFIINKDSDLYIAQQLIVYFNNKYDRKLRIVTKNTKLFSFIKNDNITISKKTKPNDYYINRAQNVIANGIDAELSILLNKNTFLVGKRGCEGLITPNNINELFLSGFSGRASGQNEETISINLLDYEFGVANARIDVEMEYIREKNSEILNSLYQQYSLEKKIAELKDNRNITITNLCKSKPRLGHDIQIEEFGKNKNILRSKTNSKIFGYQDDFAMEFLNYFDGTKSVNDYIIENNCKAKDVEMICGFLNELSAKKIVELKI